MPQRVLVFTRPRVRGYFHAIAREAFGAEAVTYVSDVPYAERVNIMRRLYACMRDGKGQACPLNPHEVDDIVARCRFLRTLERRRASEIARNMWAAVSDLLEEIGPDVVLMPPMDSYVTDILERVASSIGVTCIEVVGGPLPGYTRLARRGDLIPFREPKTEEVDLALKVMTQDSFLPLYVPRQAKTSSRIILGQFLPDLVRRTAFPVLKVLLRDPLNYRFNHFRTESMTARSIAYAFPFRYFHRQWTDLLAQSRSPVVYLPLQFYPETSTDYWTRELELTRFYDVIDQAVEALAGVATIVIKEHPNALGYRDPLFYEKLRAYDNVVLVPPEVPSTRLVERADVILAWGTTTALEALVRNKRVITFGTPYFDRSARVVTALKSAVDIRSLPTLLERVAEPDRRCSDSARKVITDILASSTKGYANQMDFRLNRQNRSTIQMIAEGLQACVAATLSHARKVAVLS